MKRFMLCGALFALMMVLFAGAALAFSFNPAEWVKGALNTWGWTAAAYLFTFILGLAVFGTILAARIINTLKAVGELLVHLSERLSDRRMTAEELQETVADIRAVASVWKTTPEKFNASS
jgi:hypothetical protein